MNKMNKTLLGIMLVAIIVVVTIGTSFSYMTSGLDGSVQLDVIEVKDGVKKEKIKKMFPGYVLVEMVMSDESWYIVRNTQGVTGFIGSSGKGAKPIPLMPQEVDRILGSMGMSRLDVSKDLETGKKVKILDGPFKEMIGKVDNIDLKAQKVNIVVDLFGQETSVEADLNQIEVL